MEASAPGCRCWSAGRYRRDSRRRHGCERAPAWRPAAARESPRASGPTDRRTPRRGSLSCAMAPLLARLCPRHPLDRRHLAELAPELAPRVAPVVAAIEIAVAAGGEHRVGRRVRDRHGPDRGVRLHREFQRLPRDADVADRKSTRLNSSHLGISYAVFCLKKKKIKK